MLQSFIVYQCNDNKPKNNAEKIKKIDSPA